MVYLEATKPKATFCGVQKLIPKSIVSGTVLMRTRSFTETVL